jgi:hypothetical protein
MQKLYALYLKAGLCQSQDVQELAPIPTAAVQECLGIKVKFFSSARA